MENKTVLITGATGGIRKQTALDLALNNTTIILHGRNEQRSVKTAKEITRITSNQENNNRNSEIFC